MYPKRWILLLAAFVLLNTLAYAADMPAAKSENSKSWEVNVMLRSSIYLPTPRPIADVYFALNNTTPSMVYRAERNQAEDPLILTKTAYATTNATPHDTYKLTPSALGPFPKGADLGFTLGQWISAIGEGTYVEEDGNATLNVSFSSLVPNGTYSIWIHRVTMPTNYGEEYLPMGTADGSQNAFKADSSGNASFSLRLKALPESSNLTFADYVAKYVTKKAPMSSNITWTLIAIMYHSDGQTHGSTPGELGKNVHGQMVHLMYPKPARSNDEWKNMTALAFPAKAPQPV